MGRDCRLVAIAAVGVIVGLGRVALAAESSPPKSDAKAEPAASAEAPLVPDKIRQWMQDRKYAEAVRAIDQAVKAPGAPVEYLAWLKGRALYLDNRPDESIAAFDALQKQFPKSPWNRRVQFSKAMALARKGDFRAAETIYRAEAQWLLSPDRKQQIAQLYLEFADVLFKPPKDDQKPDYAKALEFYKKALEVGPTPDKTTEVELLVAQCHQKLGKLAEAAGLYERFIKERADSPLDIEARFHLGEACLAQGKPKEARRAWQDLLAKHANSPSERVAEAAYLMSRTWGVPLTGQPEATGNAPHQPAVQQQANVQTAAPPPPNASNVNLGIAALEAFVERFPSHKSAARAHLEIAETYVRVGRYEDAAAATKRLLTDDRYKNRDEVPEARNLLGRSYLLQKKFPEAIAAWQEYLAKHPAHRAWSTVQREIVDAEIAMARQKQEDRQYEAAAKLYSEFLARYPLDPRNPEILFAFGAMNHSQEKWEAALADWRRLVSKYPGTDWASRAQFLIAETLERKLGRLEEAVEEYRKVTWGSHQADAKQALARLTAKRLAVATERVFRSDERPSLSLTTRNIENVSVRAYKVDLETYFRKMHLARGIEGLDIALISPDKSFEFAIPKYAKYQELESPLEVILPARKGDSPLLPERPGGGFAQKATVPFSDTGESKCGVMAVTINSKTYEATTLVIQSDLDIVAKSSRNEVFVFAENMRTGKPWAGVRLLISNGKQVFAEGVTGKDGVFRGQYKELKDAQDVRVFAVAEGHVASNVVGLQGVGVAEGLSDKGYLYTDRPAYRAGQMVHLRGCIRRAADDAYVLDKGKTFMLDVFDSRNRSMDRQKVTLGEFGTFWAHFLLPATCPQGQYRFVLSDASGRNHTGTFQVHEYALEPVRLVVDSPRRVYYRGEEIEGTIRAEFYYGSPLAGREIRYQLADDRLHTATTDAKGEIRFKLPTREFSETQVLPLIVALPERNLQTAVNYVLACEGFSIDVSTTRPVFVAGETFEATLKVLDAQGKPIAQKLTLQLLEKTVVEGKVGERLVEKHALETTASDGVARKTLKLDKGGRYILRAEGIDRFKNPITAQAQVQISDEEDKVRLRILADRHTYKAGDTASVQLVWREAPALALVTFQGARVLDYRLVELKTGANKLEIPMTPQLAPNFELSVAVMHDADRPRVSPLPLGEGQGVRAAKPQATTDAGKAKEAIPHSNPLPKGEGTGRKPVQRFHAASSPFTVERDLRVAVALKRKGQATGTVRPGEEIELTVTATDPQGKPVAAEVSLAMIEQSLLEMFGWQVPPIQDFFRGNLRQTAVRTTSSITFSYQPATRPINPRLLAEADRREVAAEEAASRRRIEGEEATLRMAVTPRIVTTEEEEEKLGVSDFNSDIGLITGTVRPESAENLDVLAARGNRRDAQQVTQGFGQMNAPAGGVAVGGRTNSLGAYGGGRASERRVKAGAVFDVASQSLASAASPQGDTAAGTEFSFSVGFERGSYRGVAQRFRAAPLYYGPAKGDLLWGYGEILNRAAITTVDANGRMQEVNFALGDRLDRAKAEAMAAELAKSGTMLLTGVGPQETGYWNPAVVTGADGKATLTVAVPERSTAWRLVAKGITAQTLAGETASDLVVKKELFGELKLPMAFTDGDEAEVVATVHNDAIDQGTIEVALKTTVGPRASEEKKTIEVKSKGLHEVTFKVSLRRPEPGKDDKAPSVSAEVNAVFELTVGGPGVSPVPSEASDKPSAGGQSKGTAPVPSIPPRDMVRRVVPLLPYGMPVYATASGSATSDTTAWVDPPKDMPLASPGLQILVGPTVERSLMDIVLGAAPSCQVDANRFASGLDTATSDLMASIALQKLMGAAREAGSPQAQSLDGRVRSSIALLIASQRDDGAWSWTGRGDKSDRYSSARAVWALSLARAAGYPVRDEAYQKAIAFLKSQAATSDNSDFESKAILLHALTEAGQGDFALANRLYRERQSLSTAALAHLALALAGMDRKSTAGEILTLVAQRNLDDDALRRSAALGSLPWSHAPAELRALVALAIQNATPQSPQAKVLIDWLLAHRVGHRWAPDKATGPAALALCEWFAQSRFQGEHYRLAVFVNDVQAKVLDIDESAGTQTIDVPAGLLKPGKQRVNFQITGRGRYTYQCILGGFVPADQLKNTSQEWEVRRHHEPAPLELDGREIPRGFGVLDGGYTTFRNPLTQLPVGRRGQVELEVWRRLRHNTPEEQLEYLVITEPIPCGASVVEKSIQGGFERYEIGPGAITFYVGNRQGIGSIRYDLAGYLPGAYRAAPTVLRNAYRPEQLMVAAPKLLTVLPAGRQSADKYQPTPQELYELGKRHMEKHDSKAAAGYLTELVEKWTLRPEIYKDAVQKLLDAHLELGPAGKIVRYFEVIKEKWPAEEIPFAKIVKVGSAYEEMGEYERSYLIFRATVESSFGRESGVAGFLESQGEFLRSVESMGRLLREYPPEGYAAAATYALAQRVYAKAPEAAEDAKLRQAKVNRVDLVRRAWGMLESFLTAHPDDPAADQAAFAAANALLELKRYDQAADACKRYASRYPKSDLLDSYWYLIGYCRFATAKHEEALEMCRKVAEHKRIDRQTGQETESPNKWRAVYILGQIYHSLGKAAEAIGEYRRVEQRFPDAKEAIDYFLRKAIELPEVTVSKPGTPVSVDLKFRNIAACDVKVYGIDLMKFSLLKRNLGGITGINLAGIRPHHEATLKLGDGRDYRDRTQAVPLPLKTEGAYLVVCRGEDLYASGLVLVTPLAVEVQEDATSGRVRTTVKDSASGGYVHDVHVKVIGTRNSDFVSGSTDLRGVFVADGIRGTSTVIAQADPARYAFFRGQIDLNRQEPRPAATAPAEAKQPADAGGDAAGKGDAATKARARKPAKSLERQLLEGIESTNYFNQTKQVDQLKSLYKRDQSGVEAQKAY